MIIAVALLAGCSRPNQDAGTGSHETVSGAFGWVFGNKLPDQYPVTPDDDGTFFYTYETNGFFQTISVNVDEQRQICMIRGFAPANSLGSLDSDNLVEELTKKYGLNEKDIRAAWTSLVFWKRNRHRTSEHYKWIGHAALSLRQVARSGAAEIPRTKKQKVERLSPRHLIQASRVIQLFFAASNSFTFPITAKASAT